MKRDVLGLISFAFVALLLAVVSLNGFTTSSAHANGGARVVVQNTRAGPYEFQVGIFPGRPIVGNLHLSILVKDAEAGTPVTDATIMIAARGPAGATDIDPVRATNTPQSPQFYDADIGLDAEGSWTLTLETDSQLGQARLDVPLEVTAGGAINLVWLLAGLVAVVALGIWMRDRIRAHRRTT